MNETKELGDWGEEIALQFYLSKGATLVSKNFCKRGGEIDLIVFHDDNLVFTEVRTRSSDSFMSPLDSIDLKKQTKIKRTAQHFYSYVWKQESICRFDVISIIGDKRAYKMEHLEDAFI